jgi:Calcium binding
VISNGWPEEILQAVDFKADIILTRYKALGWYYYLENKIHFPCTARCIASKVISPLRKGETVEGRRLAPETYCMHDMLMLISLTRPQCGRATMHR